MSKPLRPVGQDKPVIRKSDPANNPNEISLIDFYKFSLYSNKTLITPLDSGFKSGFPITRKPNPIKPIITPKLQADFSKFLSKYDLSKGKQFNVPVKNSKLRVEIYIDPIDNQIKVWVFANDKEGALATLIADAKGKLTKVTDTGLEVENLTRETVALYYDRSPKLPMREALIEAFHIPPVTKELKAREAKARTSREAHKKRLATVKKTKTRIREITRDHPKSVEVFQHEYSITRPGNDRSPFLQTFGAGPCVVLTFYDKSTKTGLMAHLDATTNIPGSFSIMIDHLQKHGVKVEKLEARIIGGQKGQSEELILALRDQLRDRSIRIVEEDIVESTYDISAVVLDTNTGELYDYTETQLTRSRTDIDLAAMKVLTSQNQPLSFHRSDLGMK